MHLGDHCAPVSGLAEESEKLMVLTQATVMPMVADFPYYRWLSPRGARHEIVLDVLDLQKASSLSGSRGDVCSLDFSDGAGDPRVADTMRSSNVEVVCVLIVL